jgi:hypothetical protein
MEDKTDLKGQRSDLWSRLQEEHSAESRRGSLFPAESKYLGLTQAVQKIEWIRGLLADLGFKQESATHVNEDNQACISMAMNLVN